MTRLRHYVIAGLAMLALSALSAAPARAQWNTEVSVYLWALGLDGDMTIQGNTASTDVGFSDIRDALDFAFSLHVEAQKPAKKWTIFFDIYHAQLGDDLGTPPGEFDMDMSFVELAGAYRTGQELDFFYGLRYVTLDGLLRIRPGIPILPSEIQAGDEQDFFDPFFGARLIKDSGKWGLRARFDVAGFGITDGSDLTLNAQLLGIYRAGQRTSLLFGYRIMDMDYENRDDAFAMDITMSGPVLAASFNF